MSAIELIREAADWLLEINGNEFNLCNRLYALADSMEQQTKQAHCCPECGLHFTGEFPFNYSVHAQEAVYLFRRKGLDDFCTCTEERYRELSDNDRFEVKTLFTHADAGEVERLKYDLRQARESIMQEAKLANEAESQLSAIKQAYEEMKVGLSPDGIEAILNIINQPVQEGKPCLKCPCGKKFCEPAQQEKQ